MSKLYIFDSSIKVDGVIASTVNDQSTGKYFATDGTIQSVPAATENTWRPVSVNSSTVLLDSTTTLDLSAGPKISLKYSNNSVIIDASASLYLGDISNISDLIKSDPSVGKGDFYRVNTLITISDEIAYPGDLILSLNNKPTTTTSSDWDIIHTNNQGVEVSADGVAMLTSANSSSALITDTYASGELIVSTSNVIDCQSDVHYIETSLASLSINISETTRNRNVVVMIKSTNNNGTTVTFNNNTTSTLAVDDRVTYTVAKNAIMEYNVMILSLVNLIRIM